MAKPGSNGNPGDKRANIEEHYSRNEAGNELRRAINRLRPALRTIIEIQQSHDGSVKEVADVAGISVAAAKSRLLRARTALRRSLRPSVRSLAPQIRQNLNLES